MYRLDDESPIQGTPQGVKTEEPVWCRRIGGVARVPDNEEVITYSGYPVETQIEVHPLVLIIVLRKGQQRRASVEGVLDAASHEGGRKVSGRQGHSALR